MTDSPRSADDADEREPTDHPALLTDGGKAAKVVGELDDADEGIGVHGHNTAASGETYGVKGEVDSEDGYGLYTPDDAMVDGTLETSRVGSVSGSYLDLVSSDQRVARIWGRGPDDGPVVAFGHPSNRETSSYVKYGITISGGGYDDGTTIEPNTASEHYATICGGRGNTVDGLRGAIVGGRNNLVDATEGFVGGGANNEANAGGGVIGGGSYNTVSGNSGNIAGGWTNTVGQGAAVGGGGLNEATGKESTVGGGNRNDASGERSTIAGGYLNFSTGERSTIAGGSGNTAMAYVGAIGGGGGNRVEDGAIYSTIAGGRVNDVDAEHATVGGGHDNAANGDWSTSPGGRDNTANGNYSFAAGRKATADHAGAVVFGDSSSAEVTSGSSDQARFQMPIYADSFNQTSARAAKTDVEPVDAASILEGVQSLDVSSWAFRDRDDGTHVGPMAEDFAETFGLGDDDESIATVDADGVALAAIQGLARKVAEKTDRIDELEERLAAIEAEVGAEAPDRADD